MADVFVGQLLLGAWSITPRGFAACNGQLLPINRNTALFSLLNTYYGGDGRVTFGLPNLQGRTPIGMSEAFPIGASQGEASHTLTTLEMPTHTHQPQCSANQPGQTIPLGALLGTGAGPSIYSNSLGNPPVKMNSAVIAQAGGNQPHENRQPYLVMNWLISLIGIYPSRS